jgi:dimethylamine/trimethylamine dehydrogenase
VQLGVEIHIETEVVAISDSDCVLRHYERERTLRADTVVLATARRSNDALHRELTAAPEALAAADVEHVFAIGDCVAPRLIADCIFDGHRLAREIDEQDPDQPLPFLRERPVHDPLRVPA